MPREGGSEQHASRTKNSSRLTVSIFSMKQIAKSLVEAGDGRVGRWLEERGVE